MLTVEDPVSSLSSGDLSAKDSDQSLTSPACAFPALLYIRAWKSHGFTKIRALDLGVFGGHQVVIDNRIQDHKYIIYINTIWSFPKQ